MLFGLHVDRSIVEPILIPSHKIESHNFGEILEIVMEKVFMVGHFRLTPFVSLLKLTHHSRSVCIRFGYNIVSLGSINVILHLHIVPNRR